LAWSALAERDPAKAYTAFWSFVASPQQTLPFFKKVLTPAGHVDSNRIQLLITELDHTQFTRRRSATKELERLGDLAVPALRGALRGSPSLEVRLRVEALLRLQSRRSLSTDQLRQARAIRILEEIGCQESRTLLQALSRGAPEAHV